MTWVFISRTTDEVHEEVTAVFHFDVGAPLTTVILPVKADLPDG